MLPISQLRLRQYIPHAPRPTHARHNRPLQYMKRTFTNHTTTRKRTNHSHSRNQFLTYNQRPNRHHTNMESTHNATITPIPISHRFQSSMTNLTSYRQHITTNSQPSHSLPQRIINRNRNLRDHTSPGRTTRPRLSVTTLLKVRVSTTPIIISRILSTQQHRTLIPTNRRHRILQRHPISTRSQSSNISTLITKTTIRTINTHVISILRTRSQRRSRITRTRNINSVNQRHTHLTRVILSHNTNTHPKNITISLRPLLLFTVPTRQNLRLLLSTRRPVRSQRPQLSTTHIMITRTALNQITNQSISPLTTRTHITRNNTTLHINNNQQLPPPITVRAMRMNKDRRHRQPKRSTVNRQNTMPLSLRNIINRKIMTTTRIHMLNLNRTTMHRLQILNRTTNLRHRHIILTSIRRMLHIRITLTRTLILTHNITNAIRNLRHRTKTARPNPRQIMTGITTSHLRVTTRIHKQHQHRVISHTTGNLQPRTRRTSTLRRLSTLMTLSQHIMMTHIITMKHMTNQSPILRRRRLNQPHQIRTPSTSIQARTRTLLISRISTASLTRNLQCQRHTHQTRRLNVRRLNTTKVLTPHRHITSRLSTKRLKERQLHLQNNRRHYEQRRKNGNRNRRSESKQ